MLEGIARLAIRAPRRIIAIALLVMAGTAVFGIPVITAAALIMSISFAAMIAAQVSFMRMFGLG